MNSSQVIAYTPFGWFNWRAVGKIDLIDLASVLLIGLVIWLIIQAFYNLSQPGKRKNNRKKK
jgi:hypothetical protein